MRLYAPNSGLTQCALTDAYKRSTYATTIVGASLEYLLIVKQYFVIKY